MKCYPLFLSCLVQYDAMLKVREQKFYSHNPKISLKISQTSICGSVGKGLSQLCLSVLIPSWECHVHFMYTQFPVY